MAELKKCDMTVNVFFHRIKALSDELTSIGRPLRDDELISTYLLAFQRSLMHFMKRLIITPPLCRFVTCTLNSKLLSRAIILGAPRNYTIHLRIMSLRLTLSMAS
jgi:hypothetical protein